MTISDRLNEAMQGGDGREFVSQAELGRRSDVPQPTIARILKGNGKKKPETDTLEKLAEALGIEFMWLLKGVGPKYPGGQVQASAAVVALPKRAPVFKRHWLSEDEADHLANYRSLTKLSRSKVRDIAKGLKRDAADDSATDEL